MPVSIQSGFVRLRASGRDRSKFLHNFCTNNIRDLNPGTACEAFFTDVKARILAHGYVLALEHSHEIWLLPGDPEALLKHLTRYIITEDVTVELVAPLSLTIFVAVTPQSLAAVRSELINISDQPLQCFRQAFRVNDATSFDITGLCFAWAGRPVIAISSEPEFMESLVSRLANHGITPLNDDELERLRIEERFPRIGQDMMSENLAPEAERDAASISYTKGCYLGQEPIARLDAMGHVNRALRILEIHGMQSPELIVGASLRIPDGTAIGTITSSCRFSAPVLHGLAMVRLALANDNLHVLLPSQEQLTARVLPHNATIPADGAAGQQ